MKLKALLSLIVMALAPATFAMQMPLKSDQEAATVKTTVNGEDQCPVCQETAANTAQNELRITQCCQNFMCASCEKGIIENAHNNATQNQTPEQRDQFIQQHGYVPSNQLKAKCPLCRKDLITVPATLNSNSAHPSPFIDKAGKTFTLKSDLEKALLKCTALEKYKKTDVYDFSTNCHHTIMTQGMLTWLARFIANPVVEQKELSPVIQQFEIAHICGAPENILYILANELWPYMQDKENDAKDRKDYKTSIRELARPYLSSPRYFLNYLKSKPILEAFRKNHIFDITPDSHILDASLKRIIDLSFEEIRNFSSYLRDEGWYRHNNCNWQVKYPFHTLEGIYELIEYLQVDQNKDWSIRLRNHNLETFSCDIVKSLNCIDLTGNKIKHLHSAQLKYQKHLPQIIILDSNQIESINDNWYEAFYYLRCRQYSDCFINLENNRFSDAQKKNIREKFNKAIQSLPEQKFKKTKFENSCMYTGAILGAITPTIALHYACNGTSNLLKGISSSVAAIIGVSAGGILGYNVTRKLPARTIFSLSAAAAAGISCPLLTLRLFKNYPELTKGISLGATALAGTTLGAFFGYTQSSKAAYALAKLSHPHMHRRSLVGTSEPEEILAWGMSNIRLSL